MKKSTIEKTDINIKKNRTIHYHKWENMSFSSDELI